MGADYNVGVERNPSRLNPFDTKKGFTYTLHKRDSFLETWVVGYYGKERDNRYYQT